jgi:dTDP-L-rhamnose 4-epimerase
LDILDPQVHGTTDRPRHLEGHLRTRAIRFVHGDVRDPAVLTPLVQDCDAVIHLAAAVGVGQSMYQPHHYSDVNIGGTARLIDVLVNKPHRVKKVVVASSMSLYGEGAYRCAHCGVVEPQQRRPEALVAGQWEPECPSCAQILSSEPTPESKSLHSTSIYAITKKVQEEMLVVAGAAYQIPVVALRYFNVYGTRQSLNNPYTGVAAIFLSRLMNNKPPVAFEDGRQTRDFIHVRDVARANQVALEAPSDVPVVCNVGTGRPTSILDIARTLSEVLGQPSNIDVTRRFRAGDIRHCIADATRMAKQFNFRAEIDLADGMRELVEWSRTESASDQFDASLSELNHRRLVS